MEVLLQSNVVWTCVGQVWVGFRVFYRKEDFLVLGVLNIFRKLKNNWVEFRQIFDIKKKGKKEKKKKEKNQSCPMWIPWTLSFEPNLDPTKNRKPASTGLGDLGP